MLTQTCEVRLLWIAVVLLLALVWILYKRTTTLNKQNDELQLRLFNLECFCVVANKVMLLADSDDLKPLARSLSKKRLLPRDVLELIAIMYYGETGSNLNDTDDDMTTVSSTAGVRDIKIKAVNI